MNLSSCIDIGQLGKMSENTNGSSPTVDRSAPDHASGLSAAQAARKHRLSVVATAPHGELLKLWEAWAASHKALDPQVLRSPEIGTVMVRGRAGAVGAPFNLGEITVTRCSVQLDDGRVGHGYVQGRSKEASLIAATIDALALGEEAQALDAAIVEPLHTERNGKAKDRAEKAAATKVEFFTMVRGDN